MTSYKDLVTEMNAKIGSFKGVNAEAYDAFQGSKKAALKDGPLDIKTKELIALALGVASQCDPCIAYHAQACAKYGATRAEVADMLGVVVWMGGGPKMMYAAKALSAFDEFTAV